MTDSDDARRNERNAPPPVRLPGIDRKTAAYLLVVLSDNARTWNAPLRQFLNQVVSPTDAYNAGLELSGQQAGQTERLK